MLKEAEFKLIEMNKRRKNNKNIDCEKSLEETLEIIKLSNKISKNKDMSGTMLLHPTFHPKCISRNKLQTMLNTTCKCRFYDSLKIDKHMIGYHNPDNVRKIVIPSSLKPCTWLENSEN